MRALGPLTFDSSGSATARFFGRPVEVGIHYVKDAMVNMLQMICPDSIDGLTCKRCLQAGPPSEPRMVCLAWDVRLEKWTLYMAPPWVFGQVIRLARDAGATDEAMIAGEGPDILLQRIGRGTEAIALPETMGQARGKTWKTGPKKNATKLRHPPMEEAMIARKNASIWMDYGSDVEVRLVFPASLAGHAPLAMPDQFNNLMTKFPDPPRNNGKAQPKNIPLPDGPPKLRGANDRWDVV